MKSAITVEEAQKMQYGLGEYEGLEVISAIIYDHFRA
jgi:hypothetical protein